MSEPEGDYWINGKSVAFQFTVGADDYGTVSIQCPSCGDADRFAILDLTVWVLWKAAQKHECRVRCTNA